MEHQFLESTTFLVKTFERPDFLDRLVRSIRRFYPAARVLVADDSLSPLIRTDVTQLILPYDIGISGGRNRALAVVRTPFFVLLDDDFEFFHRTRIETLYDALADTDLDLVGGDCFRSRWRASGRFLLQDGHLSFRRSMLGRGGPRRGVRYCDWVPNFFLARTDSVRAIGGWDERLKVNEHFEFFLRARGRLKVASCPSVQILHHDDKHLCSERYLEMRYRSQFVALRDELLRSEHGVQTLSLRRLRRRRPAGLWLASLRELLGRSFANRWDG